MLFQNISVKSSKKEKHVMRSKYFQIGSFLLLTTSIILASCGGGGGGGETPPPASLPMKGTSGNAVNMNGTWSGCFYDGTRKENYRDTATFSGGSAIYSSSTWSASTNSNCTQTTTPDILFVVTTTAALSTEATATWRDSNNSVSSPPSPISNTAKATAATIVFKTATVTLGSDGYVFFYNSLGLCGGGWAKGVAKNVISCTDIFPSTTETEYWVVDDSAAQLKWYSGTSVVPFEVDNFDPLLK